MFPSLFRSSIMTTAMKKIITESPQNIWFYILFIAFCIFCFGGFTYLWSNLQTPSGIEILTPQ